MKRKNVLRGYAYIILSAVIFGCMPLMAKHLYADGVNSMTLVALRNLISNPFLLCIALARREPFPKRMADAMPVFFIGILGCAVTPFLLFSSYLYKLQFIPSLPLQKSPEKPTKSAPKKLSSCRCKIN